MEFIVLSHPAYLYKLELSAVSSGSSGLIVMELFIQLYWCFASSSRKRLELSVENELFLLIEPPCSSLEYE